MAVSSKTGGRALWAGLTVMADGLVVVTTEAIGIWSTAGCSDMLLSGIGSSAVEGCTGSPGTRYSAMTAVSGTESGSEGRGSSVAGCFSMTVISSTSDSVVVGLGRHSRFVCLQCGHSQLRELEGVK
jgi:hypothetical protein